MGATPMSIAATSAGPKVITYAPQRGVRTDEDIGDGQTLPPDSRQPRQRVQRPPLHTEPVHLTISLGLCLKVMIDLVQGGHPGGLMVAHMAMKDQVPGSSGIMSTVTIWAGARKITSERCLFCNTVLPCQCGEWKLKPNPIAIRYQRTRSPFCMTILGTLPKM